MYSYTRHFTLNLSSTVGRSVSRIMYWDKSAVKRRARWLSRPWAWSRVEMKMIEEESGCHSVINEPMTCRCSTAWMNGPIHCTHARHCNYTTTAFVRRTIYSRWIKNVCGTKLAQTASSPKNSRMLPCSYTVSRSDCRTSIVYSLHSSCYFGSTVGI